MHPSFARALIAVLGLVIALFAPSPATAARQDRPTRATFSVKTLDGTPDGDGQILTRQFTVTHPSSRVAASMANDAGHQQVVLFGGLECTRGVCNYLDDTWTWDGRAWTERFPAVSPPARATASMVYDAGSQQVLLFGGSACASGAGESCTDLDDTWAWDGQAWTQQDSQTSPPARSGASLVYDAAHQQVLLFGGIACPGAACTYFGDTWTWDGQTWTQLQPVTSPSARAAAIMTYEAGVQKVVLVGGRDCPDNPSGEPCHLIDDLWTWDGTNWTNIIPASASP